MNWTTVRLVVRQTALVLNNVSKAYNAAFGTYEFVTGSARGIKKINAEFKARRAHGQATANDRHGKGQPEKAHTNENGHQEGARHIEVNKTN